MHALIVKNSMVVFKPEAFSAISRWSAEAPPPVHVAHNAPYPGGMTARNILGSTAKTDTPHVERAVAVIPAGMDFPLRPLSGGGAFADHRLIAWNPFGISRQAPQPTQWACRNPAEQKRNNAFGSKILISRSPGSAWAAQNWHVKSSCIYPAFISP